MSAELTPIAASLQDTLIAWWTDAVPSGGDMRQPAIGLIALIAFGVLAVLGLTVLAYSSRRANRHRIAEAKSLDTRIAETHALLGNELGELKGRLSAMAEMSSSRQAELQSVIASEQTRLADAFALRQSELSRSLGERLDLVSSQLGANLTDASLKLGASLNETQSRTSESLSRLYERLALIDQAGQSLTDLSKEVVGLRDVLGNKQARGAFGQLRMETIIEDGLPRTSYSFQATLSNGKRPDCLIHLPSAPAPLVIDAKFPLEGFEALRSARNPEEITAAMARVREAVSRHVDDIATKYLIPGETQDTALMFVPSESVYADLHERFPELIQRAHRSRIVIVSPNVLMLAVQTMLAILKDVRMREQANVIQREVGQLMGDIGRLAERVKDLDKHFTLAAKDVEKILTSTERIAARGARIEAVEVSESAADPAGLTPSRALS